MLLGTRLYKKAVCAVTLPVTLAVGFGAFSSSAEAGQLRAKVFLTQESIPRRLPEKELVAFAQKHQVNRLPESKEGDIKQRNWSANLVIAFNASPGELEYQLVFYDVNKGVRILAENRSMLLSDRIQKTYLQKITLKRPTYQMDREIELVVVVRGQEVGRAKFRLTGEEPAVATTTASAKQPKPEAKQAKPDTKQAKQEVK